MIQFHGLQLQAKLAGTLPQGVVTGISSRTYFRRGAYIVNQTNDTCETIYSSNANITIEDLGGTVDHFQYWKFYFL